MQARLVVREHLDLFALAHQDVADCRILKGRVLLEGSVHRELSAGSRAFHQLVDIRAADRDRKQADSRQDGESAADVVRNDKGLISFFCGKSLQRASCLVRRGVDALRGAFLAVLLLQDRAEYAERDRRLRRRAGLGDDVHGEIAAFDDVHDLLDVGRAHAVADVVDLRGLPDALRDVVVESVTKEFDRRARAEVGAADADDEEDVGITLDLLRRLLDPRELFLVIIHRKVDPSEEVVPLSVLRDEPVLRVLCLELHGRDLVIGDEVLCACALKSHLVCHVLPPRKNKRIISAKT